METENSTDNKKPHQCDFNLDFDIDTFYNLRDSWTFSLVTYWGILEDKSLFFLKGSILATVLLKGLSKCLSSCYSLGVRYFGTILEVFLHIQNFSENQSHSFSAYVVPFFLSHHQPCNHPHHSSLFLLLTNITGVPVSSSPPILGLNDMSPLQCLEIFKTDSAFCFSVFQCLSILWNHTNITF